MKLARGAFLSVAFALLLFPLAARADSSGKTLNKYRKAIGGNAALKVTTTSMSGKAVFSDGTTGAFSYWSSAPDRLRIDVEKNGERTGQCYNGKSAWKREPGGFRTLLVSEAKLVRLAAVFAGTRANDLKRSRI